MIAVILEFTAAVKDFDGFISIKRFQRLSDPDSAYRLRVAQVLRDYTRDERAQAPADSLIFHSQVHG
jgi:hypothetical protein